MRRLLTTDLHLSDRPKDAYRFGIFSWLADMQQQFKVDEIYILGDLTERKDNHSSSLVNRIIDELTQLRPPVYILRGNHDGLDPNNPFFRFLGTIPGLDFVVEPKVDGPPGYSVAFVPHQDTQEAFDHACMQALPSIGPPASMLLTHQSLAGAIGETGHTLNGFSSPVVRQRPPLRWYSGDVHQPQTLKCGATYIGAPYHIRFGDTYTPRVILTKNGSDTDLHYPCLKKYSLRVRTSGEILAHNKLRKGDHVKITVVLPQEEVVGWAALKRSILDACREVEVQVFALDMEIEAYKPDRETVGNMERTIKIPADILGEYCRVEGVAENVKQVGAELLDV